MFLLLKSKRPFYISNKFALVISRRIIDLRQLYENKKKLPLENII
jgi:hypothetical protein